MCMYWKNIKKNLSFLHRTNFYTITFVVFTIDSDWKELISRIF